MPNYSVVKKTAKLYVAENDNQESVFSFKQGHNPQDPNEWSTRYGEWAIDSDSSRGALVNRVLDGDHDGYLTDSVKCINVSFPVRSRLSLWDEKKQTENDADFCVVHWWTKGEGVERYFKCDIHLNDEETYEGIGDTLTEALEDLVASISFYHETITLEG